METETQRESGLDQDLQLVVADGGFFSEAGEGEERVYLAEVSTAQFIRSPEAGTDVNSRVKECCSDRPEQVCLFV